MPDKANIDRLIKHINLPSTGFYMNLWKEDESCGTVACLGGWFEVLILADRGLPFTAEVSSEEVNTFLDISSHQNQALFFHTGSIPLREFDELPVDIRKRAATNVLTRLRDENIVDWNAAIAKAQEET